MGKLKGYRTYIVFTATLAVALFAAFGVTTTAEQNNTIGQVVTLATQIATNPVVLSLLALAMRSVTRTPPGGGTPE